MDDRKVYIDFRETGGTVEARPLRVLEEPVLVGRSKSEFEEQVERRFQEVKSVLRLAAMTHHRVQRDAQFARKRLVEIVLTSPGFTNVEGNLYTGWFYIKDGDTVFCLFAPTKIIPSGITIYPRRYGSRPYYLMSDEQVSEWNKYAQYPLSIEQFRRLIALPDISARPLFQSANNLGLEEFMRQATTNSENFWNGLPSREKKEAFIGYVRKYLEKLAVFSYLGNIKYQDALAQVGRFMKTWGITVFPVVNEACVVAYREGNGLRFRTLPLPHEHIRSFQRYLSFGEQPMTSSEFAEKYQRLVDPNRRFI